MDDGLPVMSAKCRPLLVTPPCLLGVVLNLNAYASRPLTDDRMTWLVNRLPSNGLSVVL